jgi:phasin family protein
MTTSYNADQIATSGKAAFETLLNFANTAFAGTERLAALNLSASRALLDDGVAHARVLSGARDIQELINLQTSLLQPATERAVGYARSVYEIVAQAQKRIADLVEDQFTELNRNFSSNFDKATKNAPAGSDVAVAAVKSAIAAANSAYESVSKAARQVAEIADANVAAATSASVKATGSTATSKARKAA